MGIATSTLIIQYRLMKEYNQKKEYEKIINKKYELSLKELHAIKESRKKDILTRGENHYVFDLNGKVVKLKNSVIWHCNGVYVEPKTSKNNICIIC